MISDFLVNRIYAHQVWEHSDGKAGTQLAELDLDLTDGKLDGLVLRSAHIGGACFTGSSLRNADLAYCILASADFSGCDMEGIALVKSDLDYANAGKANLAGSNLRKTSWNEASLTEANLSGARLAGARFTDTDLRGANLTGCELIRSRFERTRVEGVTFTGATGLEEARIVSIDTGTLLEGDAAREWLLNAAKRPGP